MALKVTTEPRENRQLGMTIEVDPERVQKELRKAAQKAANDYRIPGFRKGKAPYNIIVQTVGLPTLYSQFMDELGQELYQKAIEQEGIQPYAIASLEDVSLEPMTYKLLIPLDPEVDLGDYRSLRVEEDPVEVSDEDVEAQLNRYLDQHAGWQSVTRPSQYGDMMNIDVRSVIIPEGEEAAGEETVVLDETDWDVTPDQENPMEPPGFDEALLGLTAGAEKDFELSWPADSQSVYAGKRARFHVKVNKIQAYEKPELNDDFAKLVGPDFETLDALKANIRETLSEQRKSGADAQYAEKVLTALVEQSKLNYPPVVIEDQLDSMINEFERQLRQLGIDSLENYLQRTGGGTMEEYRERLRPEAKRLGEQNLVLSEVIRVEKLRISDEEIEARIQEMMGGEENQDDESARSMAEVLRSGAGRTILESQLLREKAMDLLLAIARGEEVPPPPADEPEAEEAPAAEGEAQTEPAVEA
jgi:trigger factor